MEGSSTSDEVYRAVGMTLTAWERIETALSNLFSIFVGDSVIGFIPITPAALAYGTVVSFNARAEILAAAAGGFFRQTDEDRDIDRMILALAQSEEEFVTLLKEARAYSARRNEIAHGQLNSDRSGSYLGPSPHNSRKNPLSDDGWQSLYDAQSYKYAAEDI